MAEECCWTREEIGADECPFISDAEEELRVSLRRRFLEKCLECPRFKNDLKRFKESGHPFSLLFPQLVDEFLNQKAQIHSIISFLDSRNREIRFLHELGAVLQASMDLEEVLSVAMTAITAGKGFGMNRAFLLLTDKERLHLKGFIGVGPRNYEEAWRTWEEIGQNNFSLKEMARNFYDTKLLSEKMKFYDVLERLNIPLNNRRHILVRALSGRKPLLVENAFNNPDVDQELARLLGVESFLVIPLLSRNRRVGVIIADNCITHKPITQQDIQSMETFAFPLAFAIERASLHEQLQEELDKVTEANQKLKEQQEIIVKMEKMAIVGKVTSNIAHSIRNPLMVIGGFARSLLKKTAQDDPNREYLESIVRESRQLEVALDEVLTYSDALYPAMDMWDMNQLVANVSGEMGEELEKAGIRLALDLALRLPAAYIDYKQISYCLRNAIHCVAEKSGEGGEVMIKTFLDADWSVISIVGGGGAYKAGAAGSGGLFPSEDAGSGMGVSLCNTILERHGAGFDMKNLEGGGVECTIKLPIRKELSNA